jgi:DNA-binding YbaB/EbfC family protein
MLKELGQIAGLLKQAQGLPGRMQAMQERLAAVRCVGQSADGQVTVELTGQARAVSCWIDPSLLDPQQQQRLHELLVSALNDAQTQVRQAAAEHASLLAGEIDLPGLKDALAGFGDSNE